MRTPTALAALLCAGLATSPALASSTTIIDFTIEITGIRLVNTDRIDTLLMNKMVGDMFSGVLEMANPLVDLDDRSWSGRFKVESFFIEDFDARFFENSTFDKSSGIVRLTSGSIFSVGPTSIVSTGVGFTSDALNDDPNILSVDDLLGVFTRGSPTQYIIYVTREFPPDPYGQGSEVRFDVTSASIRPSTTVIPLPAAGWLMVAGLGGLAALRRHN